MEFNCSNVNDAFYILVSGIESETIPAQLCSSRVGDVLKVEEPVLITYHHPTERVLTNSARDANPFFHLIESLWMLAGRNDVALLAHYNSQIAAIASDDGETFNGAYGYRWRHAATVDWLDSTDISDNCNEATGGEVDQLAIIIDQLKRKPDSRRCVLQMWNVEDDLLKIDQTKDVCCNCCAFFSIRQHGPESNVPCVKPGYLDMTVVNRSNDLVWGMLGANAVHFSFLQEYMASAIGVGVGVYRQFTNNLHTYISRWQPQLWLSDSKWVQEYVYSPYHTATIPLVRDIYQFDQELPQFIDSISQKENYVWQEPFLNSVATPMVRAFEAHKQRDYKSALDYASLIAAADWRIVSTQWLTKRQQLWEQKHEASVD